MISFISYSKKSSTDTVYFASYLASSFPDVFWSCKLNLEAHNVQVKLVNGTHNIWIRDYFPIQVNDHFVKFQYRTVGISKYPQLNVAGKPWMDLGLTVIESPLVIDGGNVVMGQDKVVLTDKVLKENGDCIKQLEKLLEREVIIIPVEPGDDLGHADGICKFVGEQTIIMNSYKDIAKKDPRFEEYENLVAQIFYKHKLTPVFFPNAYDQCPEMTEKQFRQTFGELADTWNPGWGYYLNYVNVGDLVLVPAMGLEKDKLAIHYLHEWYPKHDIIAVDCRKLSMLGGLVHCITWNMKQ